MKIGIVSDIHGNHFALEEVLKDCKKNGIERLLVLGDLVGYYYHPEKVLSLLSGWPCDFIKGNHEVILQELYENKIDSTLLKAKYGSAHEMALENLNMERMQWLFSLPNQKSVIYDNVSFQLNHGSPRSINEYLYPDTNKEILNECDSEKHDFVLVGHSHYSFSFRCLNSTLINCGSVGQSRQQGGLANWVIINTKNKSFEMKSTYYDTSELLKEIALNDPDYRYSSMILLR